MERRPGARGILFAMTRYRSISLAALVLALPLAAAAQGVFQGEGKVLAVDEKGSTVTLDHGPIPGLMPPMRMRFTVESRAQLRGIKVGDAVRFSLGSSGEAMVIVTIERLPSPVDLLRIPRVLGAHVREDLPDLVVRQ
jgi:Cu/Ag efflux protein CusF